MKSTKNSAVPDLLIILGGPTASGKSETAARLAALAGGTVISADSVQIYEGMDIGSSKPGPELLAMAPHSLLGVLRPDRRINAFAYAKLAREEILRVSASGSLPVLTGGTGLYIKAVVDGIFESPVIPAEIRKGLENELGSRGNAALHSELAGIDPEAAAKIHNNDASRIIRALEVFRGTGKTITALRNGTDPAVKAEKTLFYAMSIPRDELYGRVEARVDSMISSGLLRETEFLIRQYGAGNVDALKSLGYKQMRDVVEGRNDVRSAVEEIKLLTKNYVKRQFTWFRNDKRYVWVDNRRPKDAALHIYNDIRSNTGV